MDAKKPAPRAENRIERITRARAAAMLGCSKSQIANFEARGDLTPHRRENGVIEYDVRDVAAIGQRRRSAGKKPDGGAIEAQLFALFDKGDRTLAQIVAHTQQPSDVVLAAYERWTWMRSARPGKAPASISTRASAPRSHPIDLAKTYEAADRERDAEEQEEERELARRRRGTG